MLLPYAVLGVAVLKYRARVRPYLNIEEQKQMKMVGTDWSFGDGAVMMVYCT